MTEEPKPRFAAMAGGKPCIVELDRSAVLKLAGKETDEHVIAAIKNHAARIGATAQRLCDQGFMVDSEDGTRPIIIISAIDLD